jgi:adenosylcobinamide-GDP ribazoletransferase
LRYFLFAISFLTIIPVPSSVFKDDAKPWRALAFFPLAGAVQGILAFVVFFLLCKVLSYKIAFITSLFFYHFLNGGLHIDGLVDFSDAWFGAKKNPERFREILKDSRIGTMGAFALLFYFLTMIACIDRFVPDWKFFIALGMAGRACILICATYSKALFEDGMGRHFVQNAQFRELVGGMLMYVIIIVLLGKIYLFTGAAVVIWSLLYKSYVLKVWKGFSGDLLGAGCCLTEVLNVLVLAALT